jgi:hypothetical protein
MDFDTANENLVALRDLKASPGWSIVESYFESRAQTLSEAALAPGEPTYAHAAARERANEIANLFIFLASSEANFAARCHELAEEITDTDATA